MEVAVRAAERVFEQLACVLCLGYAGVELVDLAFREPTPAPAPTAAVCQQLTDLWEREAGVPVEANQGDALGARRRVVPSAAHAIGGWEESDALVVAQRRGR
jgi:hypothetical protein